MISFATYALFYVGVGLAVLQFVQACGLAWRLSRVAPGVQPPIATPRTLVVLCLRGADPFLTRCIQGILQQDYPNFELLIVVDQPGDDAWQPATDVVAASGATNVRIETLSKRLETCSLKCSALLQAWEFAEQGFDAVAMIDADVVPHRTWLRELVAALDSPEVGAASGNRWYMPMDAGCGSLTRYFWNAAAIVPMYWYGIAWGGSLALKTAVLRDTDYRRCVGLALSEDVMLCDLLRRAGLRLAFVPRLMMINREACLLRDFYPWMRRQLLLAKMYHSRGPLLTAHALIVGIYLTASAVGLTAALIADDNASAMRIALPLTAYFATMICAWPFLEAAVRHVVRLRGEPTAWLSVKKLVVTIVAGPLAQVLYVAASVSLLRAREVHWRGIRYRIVGPWSIRRLDDIVYRTSGDPVSHQSL